MYSLLQKFRMQYQPKLPHILKQLDSLDVVYEKGEGEAREGELSHLFAHINKQSLIRFQKKSNLIHSPLKVGVVLSGGQAPGGHNVISGLFDALKELNTQSQLFGFLDGPTGILENKYIEITSTLLAPYRNQGGFDLIGSSRTKIEKEEHFKAAEVAVSCLNLDGLVVIGGDDSNTNAALLAEYFETHHIKTRVIGVPKTIDGDLKNTFIETSFGFDTASKTYSEIIGSILRDNLSAKKYYYFIKLMGRSASHITLECALQTHPNLSLISEEIEARKQTLEDIVKEISDLICRRAEVGKNYGAILIPEGMIEFIPEFKALIQELSSVKKEEKIEDVSKQLTPFSKRCFDSLPLEIQSQLLLDRDPHGNVEVSKIETERLLIDLVKKELKHRKSQGKYQGKFSAQPHFCGYEGRSCMPSNFDSQYCYSLGHVAALLIDRGVTGYMSCVQNLFQPIEDWIIGGVPIVSMMHLEERHGKLKPVIQKALVELEGPVFSTFKELRDRWKSNDEYRFPGPIQFFGPVELTEATTLTLEHESTSSKAFAEANPEF